MRRKKALFRGSQKRASVVATVLFVVLSCLIGYGAMRWMGGAVVRYLSAPTEDVPQQTAALPTEERTPLPLPEQPQSTEAPIPVQSVETGQKPSEQTAAVPKNTLEPIDEQTEPVQETGKWKDGVRYRTEFTEDCMDAVLLLTDTQDHAEAICLLAVREEKITLVAIPVNLLQEDGRTLDSYAAEASVHAMSLLLRLEIDRYIILPKTEFMAAIKQLGTLQIVGRAMDGESVEEYLYEAEAAPLLYAERFSHILRSLPKAMHSLSLWQLLRLKTVLMDAVRSNISEADGWMLCHAVRNAENVPIDEFTLPVESDIAADTRVYRMNRGLTEPIMEKLYKSFEKTS